jgi:hypothetical protein
LRKVLNCYNYNSICTFRSILYDFGHVFAPMWERKNYLQFGLKIRRARIRILQQEFEYTVLEMAQIHITDLFFHEEIARAAGRKASDQWLSEQVFARTRLSSTSSSAPDSPRSSMDHSKPACNGLDRSQSPSNTSRADITESECMQLSDLDIDEEIGDRVGLLFTDAAHTVLRHVSCRRSPL